MTYGYSAMLKKGLSIRIEIQKSHGVGYRGPALADPLGDLVLCQSEITVKPGVGAGLFDGIKIFALEVLNQCQFEHLSVAGLADDGRASGRRSSRAARHRRSPQ